MTKFSFEVPLDYLDNFTDLQDYYFTLSFLVQDKRYSSYLEKRDKSLLTVLDNSFNELGYAQSVDEMKAAQEVVKASYVVSPDSDSWSAQEMLNMYKAMKNSGFSPEEIILPIRSWSEYLKAKEAGALNLAIPYEYRPFFPEVFPWTKMHFLGLRDPLEIKMCRPLSCDTSMPIKLALRGVSLETWVLACCPHENSTPGFFEKSMTLGQIKLARENIQALKEMCQ